MHWIFLFSSILVGHEWRLTHWAVFDLVEFTISSKTHTGKSFQLSQFVMSGAALTLPHPQQTLQENVMMQADRYENIDGEQDYPGDQVTS